MSDASIGSWSIFAEKNFHAVIVMFPIIPTFVRGDKENLMNIVSLHRLRIYIRKARTFTHVCDRGLLEMFLGALFIARDSVLMVRSYSPFFKSRRCQSC